MPRRSQPGRCLRRGACRPRESPCNRRRFWYVRLHSAAGTNRIESGRLRPPGCEALGLAARRAPGALLLLRDTGGDKGHAGVMLVFVDEAGDTGLKLEKGSSRYFIITLVIFEDHEEAEAADTRITLLRRELGLPAEYEFHFTETPERIKEAFFEAVVRYNFFYFAIVINKAKLYGAGFKVKESFYKYASSLVFQNAQQYLTDAIVVFDGSGTREFKRQLKSHLSRKINEPGTVPPKIRKVKLQDSGRNNLIQLADMVCGAVGRSFRGRRRKGQRGFRRVIAHREIYVQFWSRNKNPEP